MPNLHLSADFRALSSRDNQVDWTSVVLRLARPLSVLVITERYVVRVEADYICESGRL